jgi:hypothetical protein
MGDSKLQTSESDYRQLQLLFQAASIKPDPGRRYAAVDFDRGITALSAL